MNLNLLLSSRQLSLTREVIILERSDQKYKEKFIKEIKKYLNFSNKYKKLAEEIAGICLGYSGIQKVSVMVDKHGALRYARSVAVEIVRMKEPDE